jgi:polysaccharide biosynthesis/export protein
MNDLFPVGRLRAAAFHSPGPAAGLLLFLPLVAVLLLSSCASDPGPAAPGTEPRRPADLGRVGRAAPNLHLLQEGDVLQITFPGATNLNTVQKIPLDGMLQLPFAGSIPASGKTTLDLQDMILDRFGSQLQLQEVTVVTLSTSATIYVSGAVLRPGRIPIERPLTALEAVMEAGGLDFDRARPSRAIVIRHEDGQQKTYPIDLKQALSGRPGEPFYLRPFDIVHVPTKTFNL